MIINPRDDEDASQLARQLLEAAGDNPERVRTHSQGPRLAFEVDDDLAAAVGRTPDQDGPTAGLTDQQSAGMPGHTGDDQDADQQKNTGDTTNGDTTNGDTTKKRKS